MKLVNKIIKNVYLIEHYNSDRTEVDYTILANNQMKPLVTINNLVDGASVNYLFNDYYLIVYSRYNRKYDVPVVIEAIYDLKNDKIIDPNSNVEFTYGIDKMFLDQRFFNLNILIQAINPNYNLCLCSEDELYEMFDYLKMDNDQISNSQVINYILKEFPELIKYTNITKPLTVFEYQTIYKKYNGCYFNTMPQNIDYMNKQNKLIKKNNGN